MEAKRCTKCGEVKPAEAFSREILPASVNVSKGNRQRPDIQGFR